MFSLTFNNLKDHCSKAIMHSLTSYPCDRKPTADFASQAIMQHGHRWRKHDPANVQFKKKIFPTRCRLRLSRHRLLFIPVCKQDGVETEEGMKPYLYQQVPGAMMGYLIWLPARGRSSLAKALSLFTSMERPKQASTTNEMMRKRLSGCSWVW